MAGGGGGGSQTTRVEPPKYQLPYLERGLGYADQLYQNSGNHSQVAPFSPETEAALGGIANRAVGGSDINRSASSLATQTLNGDFLNSNPYLDATFDRAANATQGRLASQFAGTGRNVDESRGLRAQELNDLSSSIYGGAYNDERNRQMGVLGMAPGLANQDYYDLGQLANVGAQREQLTQDQLDAPGRALDQYLARVSGNMGTTQINPSSRNRLAGGIGGAMAGQQIGSGIGNGYGGWGALLGGLLGAYS
jgi:hypothetical protein